MPAKKMKIVRLLRDRTQDDLAMASGYHQTHLSRLERGLLPDTPGVRRMKKKVSEALGLSVQLVFPEDENDSYLKKTQRKGYGTAREIKRMGKNDNYYNLFIQILSKEKIKEGIKEGIKEALKTLTGREAKAIKLRFGLIDGKCYTLEEVGQHFHFTKERARQIIAKAIRKLGHPSRLRKLKDFLD